jgi:hypothetical protein
MEARLHEKGFIREFEGSWTVSEDVETGGVRVRHTLALRPALTPPYAHEIFLKQIEGILKDVENEVAAWDGRGYRNAAVDDASPRDDESAVATVAADRALSSR